MKSVPAAVLLTIAVLFTIWLIKVDRSVTYTNWPGVPSMLRALALLVLRWFVLTGAFVALLLSRRLDGWAPSGVLRALLVIGGVFALEVFSYEIHYCCVAPNIRPPFQAVFFVLAVLLPACAIAGGFFPSRALFIVGVAGAITAGITGYLGETKFLAVKLAPLPEMPQEDTRIERLLADANPIYEPARLQKALSRIEQRPDWIEQVSQQLDGPERFYALYVLCRQPARLGEAVQERCWTTVGRAVGDLKDEMRETGGHAADYMVLQLVEAVRGLAAQPGPLRDRHRAEFVAARDVVQQARPGHPDIPDLGKVDWTVSGK